MGCKLIGTSWIDDRGAHIGFASREGSSESLLFWIESPEGREAVKEKIRNLSLDRDKWQLRLDIREYYNSNGDAGCCIALMDDGAFANEEVWSVNGGGETLKEANWEATKEALMFLTKEEYIEEKWKSRKVEKWKSGKVEKWKKYIARCVKKYSKGGE